MSDRHYATDKIVHHPDAVKALADHRSHELAPIQVHLMPQNLCNQSCSFCVARDTVINLATGPRLVQNVLPGDVVAVGDERFPVTRTWRRQAHGLIEIETEDGRRLQVSDEHPVFTEQGFVAAHELRPGDRVATAMQVRLRPEGGAALAREEVALESVSEGPPAERRDVECGTYTGERADATQQPDEGSRGREEGGGESSAVPPLRGGHAEGRCCCTEADADSKPDEGSQGRGAGHGEAVGREADEQDRGVVSADVSRDGMDRGRPTHDRGQVPGLSAIEQAQGGRGDAGRVVQRRHVEGEADSGGVWTLAMPALRRQGMAVSSGVSTLQALEEPSWTADDDAVVFAGRPVRGLALRRVLSARRISGVHAVYNLSCLSGEAFVANGILTHNCSYRLEDWKNSELFNDQAHIQWPKMSEILDDMEAMGVKAVEITGGGEPLAYPHIDELFARLAANGMDTALVTNGTLLSEERADRFAATRWQWARVSIDAGTSATYSAVRRVSESHWAKAWEAVSRLASRRAHEWQRIGVGFVVTPQNHAEIGACCEAAKLHLADNVRVSIAFQNEGADLLTERQIEVVRDGIAKAKSCLEDGGFDVVNLFDERLNNLTYGAVQDYDYCGTKDVLCVIEGEGKVYTCCTLAGDPRGLMGSLEGKRFKNLWRDQEGWRRDFDVRKRCRCVCLYETRNGVFNALRDPPPHVNFV